MWRHEKNAPPSVGPAGRQGVLGEREDCLHGRGPAAAQQEEFGFDGDTYDPVQDGERLGRQLAAVRDAMAPGAWWTLADLRAVAGGSEAGISARVRDLRKMGHTVERERVAGANGLWRYRIVRGAP